MRAEPLDAETIVSATEEMLRRHGPDKTTVLDVARHLGVSHGSVYRHFPSKVALREAVIRRWLTHIAFLHDQVRAVVVDGMASGDFAAGQPEVIARAVLNATSRFHDPTHAAEWRSPGVEANSAAVVSLILDAIRAR